MKYLLLSTALMGGEPMVYDNLRVCTEAAEKITLSMGLGEATCIPAPVNLQQSPEQVFENMLRLIRSQKQLTDPQSDSTIVKQ